MNITLHRTLMACVLAGALALAVALVAAKDVSAAPSPAHAGGATQIRGIGVYADEATCDDPKGEGADNEGRPRLVGLHEADHGGAQGFDIGQPVQDSLGVSPEVANGLFPLRRIDRSHQELRFAAPPGLRYPAKIVRTGRAR